MKDVPIEIATDRLILSPPVQSDLADIIKYASDYDVAKTTRSMPHPYEKHHADYWINLSIQGRENEDHYVFGQRLRSTGQLIGGIGIKINKPDNNGSLGYWLGKEHWNQGYTTEACKAIIDFGFQHLKLHKIHAQFIAINEASGSVMKKSGMEEEAFMKGHVMRNEEYHDVYQYGILRSEWEGRKNLI